MKISFDEYRRKPPRIGWVVWDLDHWTRELRICHWWIYPIMVLYCYFRYLRDSLYYGLNRSGIMKTKIGCRPALSDIWNRKRK